jgi:hypothetical protein
VFQEVQVLLKMGTSDEFGMQHTNWQPGEKKMIRLCFIGKNLNRAELQKRLKACIFDGQYPADPGLVPTDHLRCHFGDQVLCNVGNWELSVIVKLCMSQPGRQQGEVSVWKQHQGASAEVTAAPART